MDQCSPHRDTVRTLARIARGALTCEFLPSSALYMILDCATGGLPPTIATSRPAFIASFPLGIKHETKLMAKVGRLDRTAGIGGNRAYVYRESGETAQASGALTRDR